MGKPFCDPLIQRIYDQDHDYCLRYLVDESNWYVFKRVFELAADFGFTIHHQVATQAINGPDPDSDDARSEGAPTPRNHPADLYADEPEELLLLETHGPGGPPAVLEE